jgi:hypothetical protein
MDPEILFIYGADIGEIAEARPNGTSYFTEAFASVIDATHTVRTAREALSESSTILERITSGKQHSIYDPPLHERFLDIPIFDSPSGPGGSTGTADSGPPPLPQFPFLEITSGQAQAITRLAIECSHIPQMKPSERAAVGEHLLRQLLEEIRRRAQEHPQPEQREDT